jgi:Tol biopolymer transport system component
LYNPEISPDGQNLLFCWEGQIFLMNLETKAARGLLNIKQPHVYYPHFSMDGSHIIFQTTFYSGLFKSREETKYCVINKDGTGLKAIDFNSGSPNP